MTASPNTTPPDLPGSIRSMLAEVRARLARLALGRFLVRLVAVLTTLWLAQMIADRYLELPLNARRVLLALDVLIVAWLFRTHWLLPSRSFPKETGAALLVEERFPEFRTSLISAVEFTSPTSEIPAISKPLVDHLVAQVSSQVEGKQIADTLYPQPLLRKPFVIAGAILAAALALFLIKLPVSGLLLKRVFLSDSALPSDTRVVTLTGDMHLDPGMDATLSARAEGVIPASGNLMIRYANGETDVVQVSPATGDSTLFSYEFKNVRASFQYHFELNDGKGDPHSVTVVIPPSLKEIRFTQIYPAYTGLPETPASASGLRLLQGSKLRIEAVSALPLAEAEIEILVPGEKSGLEISGDAKDQLKAELDVPQSGWQALTIRLKSADGYPSKNDPVYRVEIISDQQPLVALLQPKADSQTLLARDKVPLVFRVSDDYGLSRVALHYRVVRPGLSAIASAAESGSIPVEIPAGERMFTQNLEWELGRVIPPLTPGCRLTYWIEAEDNNTATGPWLSRSVEKRIEIVSEAQKRQELLELLGERARALEKLHDMQKETNETTEKSIR